MTIRNSVKAIIIEAGHVLLTKNEDDEGVFYLFPGGGQELSESFHEALNRECLEEIGQTVEIGELVFIREYIGKNHEYAVTDSAIHQVEFYFNCKLNKSDQKEVVLPHDLLPLPHAVPTNPDESQIGIQWVPIDHLLDYRLYPKKIRRYIQAFSKGDRTPIYLGDMN